MGRIEKLRTWQSCGGRQCRGRRGRGRSGRAEGAAAEAGPQEAEAAGPTKPLVARRRLADRRLGSGGSRRCLGRPVLLHLEGTGGFGLSGLADRQHRCLHGLSPSIDAWQFFDLSPDSPAVRLYRGFVGRGLGPDVGGQSSQAPYVQRQGGRSAFSPRGQMVEPHAVVHAGSHSSASSRN